MDKQNNTPQIDEKEMAAAEEAAKQDTIGQYTLKLKKPIEYEGKTYEELHFDFESLTGADSIEVENEMQIAGKGVVVVAALNLEYLIRISCRACREPIGHDAFKQMSLMDFNRQRDRARSFFLRSEQ